MSEVTSARTVPRLAATMMVLREQAGTIDVLMTRRHADLAFMGGLWVFPGGALAQADLGDDARALTHPERPVHALHGFDGVPLPADLCRALALAAVRETFEETGVLLATRSDGTAANPEQLQRLHAEQATMTADPARFVAVLAREQLSVDLERLIYWAHWITPSNLARRFDTRFFVAAAPASHAIANDQREATACTWMSPADLLAAARRGEMPISQPTRYNLETLRVSIAARGSLAALLRNEASREIVPIMPKLLTQDRQTFIVMPWDADYDGLPGEGVSLQQHRYDAALLALPSRVERDH